jgi:pyrroloquinoline quinone (PQQ) biosynthesis protein C
MTVTKDTSIESDQNITVGGAIGFEPQQLGSTSYLGLAIQQILDLSQRLEIEDSDRIIEIFKKLSQGWGDRKVGDMQWNSDVTTAGFPFEYSVAFDRKDCELRILAEPLGREPSLTNNWIAGLEFIEWLKHRSVDVSRFELIADLFTPTDSQAKFAIWFAVGFDSNTVTPKFKVYVNLEAQGRSKSHALLEESLHRLGFDIWVNYANTVLERGNLDRPVYLSLDLTSADRGRVKVYTQHNQASSKDLERILSLATNYVAGDAAALCSSIPEVATFDCKPLISCLSWTSESSNIPTDGTIYLPIDNYVNSDTEAVEAISRSCERYEIPERAYRRFRSKSLGSQSYISLRRVGGMPRFCVYFSPQEYDFAKVDRRIETATADIWQHFNECSIADHPLLARLKREPVNTFALWLLFINFHPAVDNFTSRLAMTISRAPDMRIRSILASQLNEELGTGNIAHIHTDLYRLSIDTVEVWAPKTVGIQSREAYLAPGRAFDRRWGEIYARTNPYQAIGGSILMELQATQFDLFLGSQVRRTNLDISGLTWLTLHETVEIEHANEALQVAQFIDDSSDENIKAAIEGARDARVASWQVLTDIYRLCFG